jgi:hypothetical protein
LAIDGAEEKVVIGYLIPESYVLKEGLLVRLVRLFLFDLTVKIIN